MYHTDFFTYTLQYVSAYDYAMSCGWQCSTGHTTIHVSVQYIIRITSRRILCSTSRITLRRIALTHRCITLLGIVSYCTELSHPPNRYGTVHLLPPFFSCIHDVCMSCHVTNVRMQSASHMPPLLRNREDNTQEECRGCFELCLMWRTHLHTVRGTNIALLEFIDVLLHEQRN